MKRTLIILFLMAADGSGYREVNLGYYPNNAVADWQKNGNDSALWHELTNVVERFYPADILTDVKAAGRINHIQHCHWQAPMTATLNLSGTEAVFS